MDAAAGRNAITNIQEENWRDSLAGWWYSREDVDKTWASGGIRRDWRTAAKNVGKWHRGVERGTETLDSAWRRTDLRQFNVQRQRKVSEVLQ